LSHRDERIGLNEAVFREVNERIEALAETFQLTSEPLDLICECGDGSCVQRISMTRAEYEQLRSAPDQFAVFPGHESGGVEEILARRQGYDVVRKDDGAPKVIAETLDPRTP
jgi:hypothetical protein